MIPLIVQQMQSPGDVVIATATVRDIHRAFPGEFVTYVRSPYLGIWKHNPNVPHLAYDPSTYAELKRQGARVIDLHNGRLFFESNENRLHFVESFAQLASQQLGREVPVTSMHGDLHLSERERVRPDYLPTQYWCIVSGGKNDITVKFWPHHQRLVDLLHGTVQFVQLGAARDWQPPLANVANLVGKTSIRELLRVIYHSEGIVAPITFPLHVAAAFGKRLVILSGGREPPSWIAYDNATIFDTMGRLPCCQKRSCFKRYAEQCAPHHYEELAGCVDQVSIAGRRFARCMEMISPQEVADAILERV